MTSQSDERMQRWQRNRATRLAALPWLHTDTSGHKPVRYLADEMIVATGSEAVARRILTSRGVPAAAITVQPALPGYVRLTAPGADIGGAVRAVRAEAGAGAAAPHHVFLSTPFEMGGPYGPPAAIETFTLPAGPAADATLRVAVVDTGVWLASPLPPAWYQAGQDDYDNTLDEDADVGHANFIIGVLMSQTTNATVQVVKVLDATGTCTEAQLAAALSALGNVDVVNLSLGAFTQDDQPPLLLQAALSTLLHGQDRAVIAAAGNEGSTGEPYWPAAFAGSNVDFASQVLAVAAHDGSALCSWSNTGPWVSLAAPGSDITSTYVTQDGFPTGFASWSGTSFSAPYVAAAVAANHQAGGTVSAAVQQVLSTAAQHHFGNYPGLP
jgi:thermitase